MKDVFREHQTEVAKKTLQASAEVLEVTGGMSKSQAAVLLAYEGKRWKKRTRR